MLHEIEYQRWHAFCKYHNLIHPQKKHTQYYYECHPTGIGDGIIAVCPVCLRKRFKKLRYIKPKKGITYYECW